MEVARFTIVLIYICSDQPRQWFVSKNSETFWHNLGGNLLVWLQTCVNIFRIFLPNGVTSAGYKSLLCTILISEQNNLHRLPLSRSFKTRRAWTNAIWYWISNYIHTICITLRLLCQFRKICFLFIWICFSPELLKSEFQQWKLITMIINNQLSYEGLILRIGFLPAVRNPDCIKA